MALLGLLCALISAYVLFVTVPDKRADGRAFATAPACLQADPSTECRRPDAATVRDTATEGEGRSARHWLTVTEKDGPSYRLDMIGSPKVFGTVRAGDQVTVTSWRSKARFVEFKGARQYTADQPKDGYRLPLSCGLALLALSGTLLRLTVRWTRRPATAPAFGYREVILPGVAGLWLTAAAFMSPLVTDSAQTGLLLAAAGGGGPVLVVSLWRARMRREPRRGFPLPAPSRMSSIAGRADFSPSGD
ncbi:hypothetical protein [Streptomyces eurocidicus]|uniref:Uncharacterized protein n=1 Tax=Streptomyces eurocidicus TaxID=66423 RepID=A0A7W8EZA5_STREU|nr:hypothetical protein [Streptomyces eurocidicus]MBB5117393.1 hypothetical protein [Streptomyces eurocidicus]MBF6053238.1 hypothetical protein [Streptomyces eurocidicus]